MSRTIRSIFAGFSETVDSRDLRALKTVTEPQRDR
jgi:hypothetical protein